MYPMIHAKGRSPLTRELRPYERSRRAEHGGSCSYTFRGVPAPPGVGIVAHRRFCATLQGHKAKAALQEAGVERGQGHYRRPEPERPGKHLLEKPQYQAKTTTTMTTTATAMTFLDILTSSPRSSVKLRSDQCPE